MRSHSSAVRRTFLTVAALFALAACGGGGGSQAAPNPVPAPGNASTPGQVTPAQLVTPTFTILFPSASTSSALRSGRAPQRVSSAVLSVTITITNPPSGLSPTAVTSNISAATCPCTVSGPPSPPGRSDSFLVQTFDATNGGGNNLDTGTVSVTPTAGQNNPVAITLTGVPATLTVTNVPSAFNAGTGSQTQPLTLTVKDAAGAAIIGAFANPVTLTDPDANGTQGSQLTGTTPGTCSGTCVTLNNSSDTATLNYGGLAENPVTLTVTGTGVTTSTTTFTPVLAAIAYAAGPTSAAAGAPKGIDLFTNVSTSAVGFSGTESYTEAGFTNVPYNRTLSLSATPSCAAFATLAPADNTTTGNTDFTATAVASPAPGLCTITVGDGLAATGHGTGGPQFVVTYTVSSVQAN
jgi:hypothetical protein